MKEVFFLGLATSTLHRMNLLQTDMKRLVQRSGKYGKQYLNADRVGTELFSHHHPQ